jgi:uncharacterized membrane protein YesL
MKGIIFRFFSNDSVWGQIMTRAWILIGANIMFVLFSLPIVTAGPAFAALYHVMLRTLRSDGEISPLKEFWKGFKGNFRQALVYWLIVLALVLVGVLDIRFSVYMGGILTWFKYGIYLIGGSLLILTSFLFPVMAAFDDSLRGLVRNAFYFIGKNPVRALLIALINAVPIVWTYMDLQRLPLYSFIWVTLGFSACAMAVSSLLIGDFNRFLPTLDEFGNIAEEEKGPDLGDEQIQHLL